MSDTITLVNKAADKLFIGMDLHKNTSTFVVKDKEGKLAYIQKLADENVKKYGL